MGIKTKDMLPLERIQEENIKSPFEKALLKRKPPVPYMKTKKRDNLEVLKEFIVEEKKPAKMRTA